MLGSSIQIVVYVHYTLEFQFKLCIQSSSVEDDGDFDLSVEFIWLAAHNFSQKMCVSV